MHPVLRWDVGRTGPTASYAVGSPAEGAVAYVRRGPERHGWGWRSSGPSGDRRPPARRAGAGPGHRRRDGAGQRPGEAYPLSARRSRWAPPARGSGCGPAPLPRRCRPRSGSSGSARDPGRAPCLPRRAQPADLRPAVRAPGQLWVGIRDDDGALAAIGCSEPNAAGVPTSPVSPSPPATGAGGSAPPCRPISPARRSSVAGCARLGDVRRQHRRPAALPAARLPHRHPVDDRTAARAGLSPAAPRWPGSVVEAASGERLAGPLGMPDRADDDRGDEGPGAPALAPGLAGVLSLVEGVLDDRAAPAPRARRSARPARRRPRAAAAVAAPR